MDGDPAYVLAHQLDLADVDARSQLDPELAGGFAEGKTAPNRAGRAVEGRQESAGG